MFFDMTRLIKFVLIPVFFITYAICAYSANSSACKPLFFKYSELELAPLKNLNSPFQMSEKELEKFDSIAEQAADENKLTFYQHARMFTYLYVAQEEMANLSLMLKGSYQGTLNTISKKILILFIPNIKLSIEKSDPYSEKLADIVFQKIKKRAAIEDASKNKYEVPPIHQEMFSSGLDVAKWIPWLAIPPQKFWPAPPPPPTSPVWKAEILKIKEAQSNLTDENKKIIYQWAGLPNHWSQDWRRIANQFLIENNISFTKQLQVRSVLNVALYDTIISYITMKYHYQTLRPQIIDPTVKYYIKVPKHPSYPAGHAAESACAATIMDYFFSSQTNKWQALANQCSNSRVWSGVHYPIDLKGGKEIGNKVSNTVLSKLDLDCRIKDPNS